MLPVKFVIPGRLVFWPEFHFDRQALIPVAKLRELHFARVEYRHCVIDKWGTWIHSHEFFLVVLVSSSQQHEVWVISPATACAPLWRQLGTYLHSDFVVASVDIIHSDYDLASSALVFLILDKISHECLSRSSHKFSHSGLTLTDEIFRALVNVIHHKSQKLLPFEVVVAFHVLRKVWVQVIANNIGLPGYGPLSSPVLNVHLYLRVWLRHYV